MKNVLVVGQTNDPHISTVINHLKKHHVVVHFFNAHKLDSNLIQFFLNNSQSHIKINDMSVDLTEIDSVWWRFKPSFFTKKQNSQGILRTEFVKREWAGIMDSLTVFTNNAKWINPRQADLLSRNKPAQLFIAKKIGFDIPNTLISNYSKHIKKFVKQNHDDCIYKVLSWYIELPDKAVFTSRVNSSHLKNNSDSIKIAPGIFQNRLDKNFELRITTVGEDIFPVKIDSQELADTKLDWRHNQLELKYSLFKLPNRIEQMIKKMNKKFGLVFAAYDFVVTPSGEYFFLEVNPAGQWLWIEKKLNIPISKTLSSLLIK